MAAKFVGEAFISGAIQLLLERFASPEVLNYFLGNKGSDSEVLLKKLNIMVSSLSAVLGDAEQRQIRDDRRVEAWLDEVQEAVFDADDLLDEIETAALRRKAEGEPSSGTSEVREFKRQKIFNFFYKSCNSNESDMEDKIKKLLDRLEEVAKQRDLLGLEESFVEEKRWQRLPSTSLIEESDVFGRDDNKEDVIKLLLSDETVGSEKICVIPIVGMGGVGKTTLAQAIFNDCRVKHHFDVMSWVCVSEYFDVCRITGTLLQTESSSSSYDAYDLNSLQVKLREKLNGKKFLFVFDDVWNEKYSDWEVVRMPFKDGAKGSKIILTTRSEEVASIVGKNIIPTHRLDVLTEEASWKLFSKHALGNLTTSPDFERVGREIMKKCKGLPLAVKTLGGILRSKLDIDHWEGILASDIWELKKEQSDILPALRLSYHFLPSHLKRCFVYCSIFPNNYKFDKEELILLWMAENLLEQPKGNQRIEDVGDQHFNQLVSLSFFQRSSINEKSCFVIHDLVVDLAKFVSGKYYFRLESGNSYETVTKAVRHTACLGSPDVFSERFNSIFEAVKVKTFLLLNFRFRGPRNVSKRAVRDFFSKLKYLRALSFSCHCYECGELVDSICGLTHLRFLDLSRTWTYNCLPSSLSKLYNLQTLKLAGCDNLCMLPSDFHRLINLRYLDVSNTRLKELPESLSLLFNLQKLILVKCHQLTKLPESFPRLINLRYLDVEGSGLKEMPKQISKLQSLQTLSTFVVGKDSGAKIRELGILLNLRERLCIKNLQNMVKPEEALEAKLRERKYVDNVKFEWDCHEVEDSIQERRILNNLVPHTSLKNLEIIGYGGTRFPDWLCHHSFCNVVYVHLTCCNHCLSLPPLGQLSSLKTLRIERFDAVVTVGPEFCGTTSSMVKPFASLEVLEFYEMPNWKEWSMPDGDTQTFPRLMKLSLGNCSSLTGDLRCLILPLLKEITISECQQLASSLPMMPKVTKLALVKCPAVIIRSAEALESYHSLVEFSLEFREGFFRPPFALDLFPNIQVLKIQGCKNLDSLWLSSNGLSFEGLLSLSTLHITNCPDLTLLSNKLPNLTSLRLNDCMALKFLPEHMHNLLPSLTSLQINACPELEPFPISGLPSSLCRLSIGDCDKIVASRRFWNLQSLQNLTSFTICGYDCKDMKSFPEEGLLPITLTKLEIVGIRYLQTLNNKELQQLTSLKHISIYFCQNLKKMTEEGLPPSLEYMGIIGCPLVEKKCQKETGEYWNKIVHIRTINISGIFVQT